MRSRPSSPTPRQRLAASVALLAGLLSCAQCSESSESPPTGAGTGAAQDPKFAPPRRAVRLARLLYTASASVQSPLRDSVAVTSLAQVEGAPRKPLLEESFEAFDMKAAGWPKRGDAVVVETDGGHALAMRKPAPGYFQYGWTRDAQPNTHYIFERRIRASAVPDVDFAVIEKSEVQGRNLKVHWPGPPDPDGTWQSGSVSFFTTPETRSLLVFLRFTSERQKAVASRGGAAAGRGASTVAYDDLELARIDPTPEQTIALLKARDPAHPAGELGIQKHGQFPPQGKDGEVEADDNYSYRYALYAPPATDLRFFMVPPENATLRFSTCLSRYTPRGDAARFSVLVESAGATKQLFDGELTADGKDWRWHDETVSLKDYGKKPIELVLRTRAEYGNPHPMWGNPVVDAPPARNGPRNVIFIAVDTLRADRMSCYGHSRKTTPHVDALARDGVLFDQVTANSNWTCPSFASIFTGLVPSRHGVFSFGTQTPLSAGLDTLAEKFQRAGWATYSIAYKVALYDGGYEQGFDVALNVPRSDVHATLNLQRAMYWLDRNADRRNFLFLHFNDPHQPFNQPSPWDKAFGDPAKVGITLPSTLAPHSADPRNPRVRKFHRGLYDGAIMFTDAQIGAFLKALRERDIYDDAVIAFVSDHGEEFWDHGEFGHGGPKLYDEMLRVPLIVKPAGSEHARGKVVPSQVRAFDIMPTLLEMADIALDGADIDAESLVPLLAADAKAARDRIAVTESSKGSISVRTRKWKYILTQPGEGRAREALFDLRADHREKNDLAARRPAVRARWRNHALNYLLTNRPGRYVVVLDPGPMRKHEVRIEGLKSAFPMFGLPPKARRGATLFSGKIKGPIVAVASLEVGSAPVLGPDGEPAEFEEYVAGRLQALLKDAKPGCHFFDGPEPLTEQPTRQSTIDLRTMRELWEMGYTAGKGEGDAKIDKPKSKGKDD